MKSKLLPDSNEIQKIVTECFKNLYSKDLEEMNRFLNAYNLSQFNL